MVVGLRLEVVDDVHSAVFGIGYWAWVHLLGVEVTCLGQFTCRTDKVGLREEFTWTGAKLATDDVFVESVVTVDDHLVDACWRTFNYAELEIYRVALDVHLDGIHTEEEVALIHVEGADAVLILVDTFLDLPLVIDIALLELQEGEESFFRLHGITHD